GRPLPRSVPSIAAIIIALKKDWINGKKDSGKSILRCIIGHRRRSESRESSKDTVAVKRGNQVSLREEGRAIRQSLGPSKSQWSVDAPIASLAIRILPQSPAPRRLLRAALSAGSLRPRRRSHVPQSGVHSQRTARRRRRHGRDRGHSVPGLCPGEGGGPA